MDPIISRDGNVILKVEDKLMDYVTLRILYFNHQNGKFFFSSVEEARRLVNGVNSLEEDKSWEDSFDDIHVKLSMVGEDSVRVKIIVPMHPIIDTTFDKVQLSNLAKHILHDLS